MSAAGDQDPVAAQLSLIGDQRHPPCSQMSALHPALEKLHTTGFSCVDQFADHAIRVEEMPRALKEQSTLKVFAQLRCDIAHGVGLPALDRHLLLAHARL
ncbi:hypothetical protein D3C84_598200 [compost metagenome]